MMLVSTTVAGSACVYALARTLAHTRRRTRGRECVCAVAPVRRVPPPAARGGQEGRQAAGGHGLLLREHVLLGRAVPDRRASPSLSLSLALSREPKK